MKLGLGLPNTMAHETDRKLMLEWARLADEADSTSSGRSTSRTTTRGIRS